ncbi:MAG: TetR/AcrR family transcriptional regulator [Gaiellales bacterium]|nr:TetR/AcrR family transcriptional regulator [Gaiellales bacterium]
MFREEVTNALDVGMAEVDTKDRVLAAAVELFATRGFDATSIRDIAKAMGMSISSIYHYFGNKEGILVALIERSSRKLMRELDRVLGLDMTALDKFELLVRTHIQLGRELNHEAKIYLVDSSELTAETREIMRKMQREVFDLYHDQLAYLQQLGIVAKEHDLRLLTLNVLGVINWPLRWYHPGRTTPFDEVLGSVVGFIMRGAVRPHYLTDRS